MGDILIPYRSGYEAGKPDPAPVGARCPEVWCGALILRQFETHYWEHCPGVGLGAFHNRDNHPKECRCHGTGTLPEKGE